MKGVITPPASICTQCVYGVTMDQPTQRVIHCRLISRRVPLNIQQCSHNIPRGGSDALWGGDAYAKGIVLDLRPDPAQHL